MFNLLDGKYVVLPSGELQIRNVSPDDGFKTYKCRTKHRLTGDTKLSATAGKLVITGRTTVQKMKMDMQNTRPEYEFEINLYQLNTRYRL